MPKKTLSPFASDLMKSLNYVHDDVTGRRPLLRLPRKFRISQDLSGDVTLETGSAAIELVRDVGFTQVIDCHFEVIR
jgi:hypothetical protein